MNNFYMSDIKESAHIHFIGIGGISMSALAHICIKRGYTISGSDINETHITRQLADAGVKIYKGHSAENINGADLVVYTAAINAENEELAAAKKNGLLCVERSTFLGAIMRDYKCSICVAGTHGKTTTTSMLSHVLLECDCDPTIMLGGELDAIGGNMRVGESEYFLTEACEYHCSFLEFFPKVAIITNVDEDHLDFFGDLEHIKSAFKQFAEIPDESGYIIVCGDDKNIPQCIQNVRGKILSYGFGDENVFCPKNLKYNDGCGEFDVEYGGKIIHVSLGVAGEHNVLNALSCFATSYALGFDGERVAAGLEKFTLVHRRFEKKGVKNGARIIDDYAHHPTEIMCTLKTARSMCKGKLYVVFQPHTYTRTKCLLDEFSKAFDDADRIIVTDIYAAREKDTGEIHASDLSKKLSERGKNAIYISSFDEIATQLGSVIGQGDIVITMGAGNVYKISEILAET